MLLISDRRIGNNDECRLYKMYVISTSFQRHFTSTVDIVAVLRGSDVRSDGSSLAPVSQGEVPGVACVLRAL